MAKLRAISGGKGKEKTFSLVYGLRLYPAAEVSRVTDGEAVLHNGTSRHVQLQVLEGNREQLRAQLLASLDAFFDGDSNETVEMTAHTRRQGEEISEAGC